MIKDVLLSFDSKIEWWRGAIVYQIYPRSYLDTNGDGIGDLKGISDKLEWIAQLGVDIIWISPFFKSPMKDFGYDVSDYYNVDPIFGASEDFTHLINRAKALKLRVIIDLVINHTSDEHPWFIESRSTRHTPKANWYVWADAKDGHGVPNNWLSLFGGSAWQWDSVREQYYLHNFLTSQPDLNFHCNEVQTAVLAIAEHWLDLGVDGFRLDTVNFYFHDTQLRDNPEIENFNPVTVPASNKYSTQRHSYDKTQPENLLFLEKFRERLNKYPGSIAIGELGVDEDASAVSNLYTTSDKRLHMVYSFDLLGVFFKETSSNVSESISTYIRNKCEALEKDLGDGWVSIPFSSHDVERVISRWGFEDVASQAAPALIALLGSLRGNPCLFQGEELGLPEAQIPFDARQDPYRISDTFLGRDGCRTPMPWNSNLENCGFSSVKPWLPIPQSHVKLAVNEQEADSQSVLHRVRKFFFWRRSQLPLMAGSISFLNAPEGVISFVRQNSDRRIIVAVNLSRDSVVMQWPQEFALLKLHTAHGISTAEIYEDNIRFKPFDVMFAEYRSMSN